MFGAIRAEESCFECHTGAKKNDLLGAFTYYLETTVDKLGVRNRSEDLKQLYDAPPISTTPRDLPASEQTNPS